MAVFCDLVYLLTLLLGLNAFGADNNCSTRDFRSDLGPIRDQADSGWCYAVSAADLATQKLKSQLNGKQISAADLALAFTVENPSRTLQSENTDIKKYLANHPSFTDQLKAFREDTEKAYGPSQITGEQGFISQGGDGATALLLSNERGLCLEERYPFDQSRIMRDLKKIGARLADKKYHLCQKQESDNTLGITSDVSQAMMYTYQEEVDKKCSPRITPQAALIPESMGVENLDVLEKKYSGNPEGRKQYTDGLFNKIDTLLDQNKALVIGYSHHTILKPDAAAIASDKHGLHASTLAGRKMIKGKCYYLLRDSFGEACDSYRPQFRSRCEGGGHLWVTKEELAGSIFDLQWLK